MGPSCWVHHHARTGAKGSEPERDTIIWYQDFEKSQKVRRGLCSRKEASHPGGKGQRWITLPETQLLAINKRESRFVADRREWIRKQIYCGWKRADQKAVSEQYLRI